MRQNKLILALIFLCLSVTGVAQSRKNPTVKTQSAIVKQSPKLRTTTGWKQDNLGNWISNANAISDTQLSAQSVSTVPQNFKWIQFVEFNANNQDLYILLYENLVYISPTQTERRVNYYIMTADSYGKLIDIVDQKIGETLTVHSALYGYMSDNDGIFTQDKLMEAILQTIVSVNPTQYDFLLNAQLVDNETVVRFRLPEQSQIIESNLTDSYFEVGYDDFKTCLASIWDASKTPLMSGMRLGTPTPIVPMADNIRAEDFSLGNQDSSAGLATQVDNTTPLVRALDVVAASDTMDVDARTNKQHAVISKPLSVLKNIKGWYNNDESEWVSDGSPSYRFETAGSYEIRRLTYRQKEYYVFIKYEKFTGASFYLVSKDDYENNVKEIMGQSIIRIPYICNYAAGYTLEEFVAQAETVLDTPKAEKVVIVTDNIVIQYKVSKTKNIARFFIFAETCTQYGVNGNTNCQTRTSSKIKYDDVPLLTKEALFTKMYYETTYDAFNSFLHAPLVDMTDGRSDIKSSNSLSDWDDRG